MIQGSRICFEAFSLVEGYWALRVLRPSVDICRLPRFWGNEYSVLRSLGSAAEHWAQRAVGVIVSTCFLLGETAAAPVKILRHRFPHRAKDLMFRKLDNNQR